MDKNKLEKFKYLSYKDFQELAKDNSFSKNEKIGFPNNYREKYDEFILKDILTKNPLLMDRGKRILDIGSGCSYLIELIIDHCKGHEHELVLIDSQEMHDLLPKHEHVTKIAGYYPNELNSFIEKNAEQFDCIITYSVFHYIFEEGNIYKFIDKSLEMLKPGGSFLIGDIPNISKRFRFFASDAGIKFHQDYTQTNTLPEEFSYKIHHDKIDDGVILGILSRYRNLGFETYLIPQNSSLPMQNRREDILITRF